MTPEEKVRAEEEARLWQEATKAYMQALGVPKDTTYQGK